MAILTIFVSPDAREWIATTLIRFFVFFKEPVTVFMSFLQHG